MCRKCIIIGAFVNLRRERFDVKEIASYDSLYRESQSSLRDTDASQYLAESISSFLDRSVRLVPISVDSDGSCLTHSISRSLVCSEIFYDGLRSGLTTELGENMNWYRKNSDIHMLNDEEFELKFAEAIESAKPTRGKRVGEKQFMGDIHIQGLSNALKRPILVLDRDCYIGCSRPGLLYLPLRFSREEVLRAHHGRMPSPVVIGWQSQSHAHYASLWRSKSSELDILNSFRVFFALSAHHEIVSVGLQVFDPSRELSEKCLDLLANSDLDVKKEFIALYGAEGSVVGTEGKKGSASLLRSILVNVLKGLDGQPILGVSGNTVNPFVLKTSSSAVERLILNVPVAECLLRLLGFEKDVDQEKGQVLVYRKGKEFGAADRIDSALKILDSIVLALSKQIQRQYSCCSESEMGFVYSWGLRSSGICSALLADGHLQEVYDHMISDDQAGQHDSVYWESYFTDPCAHFGRSLVEILTENVPSARLDWALVVLRVLEGLTDALSQRVQCLVMLTDMRIRAAVFRVIGSQRVLGHVGFSVEKIDGVTCLLSKLCMPESLDIISNKVGFLRRFAKEIIASDGGVSFPGNAPIFDLGDLVSLSLEAQCFLGNLPGSISGESDLWRRATEIYGDGPFGESQIGAYWAFGTGNPDGEDSVSSRTKSRVERVMSALAPDKYGVQFLKRYKIEEDIVQLKSDVGKLCPADQTLVSVLAPTSMDQISIICPACGADNRLSYPNAEICLYEPLLIETREVKQFMCKICAAPMSLAESNIYRISELTESLYRNYESGASWVCEARATVDGSVCGVLNDLDVCTLCSSKRDRADDVTPLLNSSVDDETTHSNFPLLGKRKEINNSEQSDKSSET